MIEVLHIVNKWERGGVERFIEGLVEGCGDSDIHQSILSVCTEVNSDVRCEKYGPLHTGAGMVSMLLGAYGLRSFFQRGHFDVVHIHTNNSSGFLYADVAKQSGVPKRIIHSHNSSLGDGAGLIKRVAQFWFRWRYAGAETDRLACSHEAGEHLFSGMEYKIVPNGIDIDRFSFDGEARTEVRKTMGVASDVVVVGCSGTFIPAKNHMRALHIFSELHRRCPDSHLVFLGDGELREKLVEEATRLGVIDSVLFAGFVDDTERWYSAMDALLFPSLYEGFPISVVEAQCSGLPVICSDAVTREVALTDAVRFLSLSERDDIWAEELLHARRDRSGDATEIVGKFGFSRTETIRLLSAMWRDDVPRLGAAKNRKGAIRS